MRLELIDFLLEWGSWLVLPQFTVSQERNNKIFQHCAKDWGVIFKKIEENLFKPHGDGGSLGIMIAGYSGRN